MLKIALLTVVGGALRSSNDPPNVTLGNAILASPLVQVVLAQGE